jgi:hypothetical protein
MKIRIKGNSIRYRLTKTEVELFCRTGRFEESTDFGNTMFIYALQAKTDIDTIEAQFQSDTITLFLDKEISKGWNQDQRVGFSHTAKLSNGSELALLIEKDFVCMDETVEDQSDNYPNPKVTSFK